MINAVTILRRGILPTILPTLLVVLLLAPSIQAKAPANKERLIILGVDGVTFKVLNPLVEAGRLPNIKRLIQNGATSTLLSEKPMRSPALWTTIATGQSRDAHGIYDFVTGSSYWPKHLRRKKRKLVTSKMLKVKPLWSMASDAGLQSLVVGWLNTWPAQPLKGAMVAPYVALGKKKQTSIKGKIYKRENQQTYPPRLFSNLKDFIYAADDVPADRIAKMGDMPPKRSKLFKKIPNLKRYLYTVRWSIASALTNTTMLEYLLQKYPDTSLAMSYFDGSDTLAHRFWLMRQPLQEIRARLKGHHLDPKLAEELKSRFGQILDNYYELIDEMVGRIQRAAGPNATIVLISDHGWGKQNRNRAIHKTVPFDGRHELEGILIASGPHIKHGQFRDFSIYDIVPTALYLMQIGIPTELSGSIALEIISEDFKTKHPPITLAKGTSKEIKQTNSQLDETHYEQTELERLKSLGYVQ